MTEAIGPRELFGTDEPPPARRRLVAGPLSAVLEDGNLRDIRFGDVEVVRAINYLARDAAWGTLKPALTGLAVAESDEAFSVAYDGLCGEPGRGFSYRVHIRGEASGRLVFEADGVALDDFLTNRTGFVVLHPAEAAGARMEILHGDGSLERSAFPRLISADQPAFDIRAITHDAGSGIACTVATEGDAFEMEDQRNWADASFKTYVRPLSKPRPYVIAKGSRDRQRITLTLEAARRAEPRPTIAAGPVDVARMPEIALFVDESGLGGGAAATQWLVARLEPEGPGDAAGVAAVARAARAAGSRLAVELVLAARDPDAETAAALAALRSAGVDPAALLLSPRREFQSRPSNSLPDGEAAIDALVAALRRAGYSGAIGAGTPSYFTEFNRNPPGTAADFAFFSVAATVHAADDASVAETLSVYPALVASARALCPGLPIWLGPCTIGVRHNPYGAATQPNPGNGRVPSATLDPRQGALFGAAYAAAAVVQAALAGVQRLTLAAAAGPFGIAGPAHGDRPIAAVVALAAAAAGASGRRIAADAGVYGIAWDAPSGGSGLVANLSPEPVRLDPPTGLATWSLLGADAGWSSARGGRLELPPFRTARLAG